MWKAGFLTVAVLVIVSGLQAAPTVYTSEYNFSVCEGLIWDTATGQWSNPTVQWGHSLPMELDLASITEASLTIQGSGIQNALCDWDLDGPREGLDKVQVYFNSALLGSLAGDTTQFDLTPDLVSQTNLCQATITFVMNRGTTDSFWPVDTVRLDTSTLRVTSAQAVPAVVPAPGAVVLAGLGVTLVGWLRRRKA